MRRLAGCCNRTTSTALRWRSTSVEQQAIVTSFNWMTAGLGAKTRLLRPAGRAAGITPLSQTIGATLTAWQPEIPMNCVRGIAGNRAGWDDDNLQALRRQQCPTVALVLHSAGSLVSGLAQVCMLSRQSNHARSCCHLWLLVTPGSWVQPLLWAWM